MGSFLWKNSNRPLMNFNVKQVADKDEALKLDNSVLLRLISSAWLVEDCIRHKSIGTVPSTQLWKVALDLYIGTVLSIQHGLVH